MSFSIYYEAFRDYPLTKQEQIICPSISERYCSQCPLEKPFEEFGVYDYDSDSNVVFSGSTKLPDSDLDVMFQAAIYWLQCLTEITRTLPDCRWTVSFEEVELLFDAASGWYFPSDM